MDRPESRPAGAPRRVRDLALRLVGPAAYALDGAADPLSAADLVARLQEKAFRQSSGVPRHTMSRHMALDPRQFFLTPSCLRQYSTSP